MGSANFLTSKFIEVSNIREELADLAPLLEKYVPLENITRKLRVVWDGGKLPRGLSLTDGTKVGDTVDNLIMAESFEGKSSPQVLGVYKQLDFDTVSNEDIDLYMDVINAMSKEAFCELGQCCDATQPEYYVMDMYLLNEQNMTAPTFKL